MWLGWREPGSKFCKPLLFTSRSADHPLPAQTLRRSGRKQVGEKRVSMKVDCWLSKILSVGVHFPLAAGSACSVSEAPMRSDPGACQRSRIICGSRRRAPARLCLSARCDTNHPPGYCYFGRHNFVGRPIRGYLSSVSSLSGRHMRLPTSSASLLRQICRS
jgi:hypothetical protein